LVRIAEPAARRGQGHPLKGALAYRADERPDADPLRWALICGVAAGLTEMGSYTAPMLPQVGGAALRFG
jgi:hypothetical protein